MDTINWITDVANWLGNDGIIFQVAIHLIYTCLSLAIAALISVPLGIYVGHTGKGESLIVGSINTLRALPTLGLLILIVLLDRKSTRLNSSHVSISYAVFCLNETYFATE